MVECKIELTFVKLGAAYYGMCRARRIYTVEPPNNGQVGTLTDVRYSEVVLYWGVFAKNPLFYIFICCTSFILHFYDILDRIQC